MHVYQRWIRKGHEAEGKDIEEEWLGMAHPFLSHSPCFKSFQMAEVEIRSWQPPTGYGPPPEPKQMFFAAFLTESKFGCSNWYVFYNEEETWRTNENILNKDTDKIVINCNAEPRIWKNQNRKVR